MDEASRAGGLLQLVGGGGREEVAQVGKPEPKSVRVHVLRLMRVS